MKKNYEELRAKSRFKKTIAITPEVYQWIKENRGNKSRAEFLDTFINKSLELIGQKLEK